MLDHFLFKILLLVFSITLALCKPVYVDTPYLQEVVTRFTYQDYKVATFEQLPIKYIFKL